MAPAIAELALNPDTTIYSHDLLPIGGINAHIYGAKEACALASGESARPWVVLHLVHPRTRDYTYTQTLAHLVLTAYYNSSPQYPMIATTFDLRNHGSRKISESANEDWAHNNPTHGQDMLSGIQGTALDFEIVLKYLPTYLPSLVKSYSKVVASPSRIIDIISGVSQGGHIAWQVAASGLVKAVVPIIGSPYLTFLLIHRLLVQVGNMSSQDADDLLNKFKPLYKLSYQELSKDVLQTPLQEYYPEALHNIVSEMDRRVFETIDPAVVHTFIINSKEDPLVPARFTHPWVAAHSSSPDLLYEQSDVGHVCTMLMVEKLSHYLIETIRKL